MPIFVGWVGFPVTATHPRTRADPKWLAARAPVALWRSVRALPEFRRLLELRAVSSFGDGLFQGGLVGALLFDPDRATSPWEIAGSFAVLFLPYSLLGPFAGALLDRWDRRGVLIGANLARLVLMVAVALLLSVRRRRPVDPARGVGRQRLHPIRVLRTVGGTAARGATAIRWSR